MQEKTKIAVVGATGRLGRHVVEVLDAAHDVVPISRSRGVDVFTGKGLAEALSGVQTVIDVSTYPTPDQEAATEFFSTAARNLHEVGEQAGVKRMVEVSIVSTDKYRAGYGVAKAAHEKAMLDGPIPVQVLRATQFFEFVEQLLVWTRLGDVAYLPKMQIQPVAARAVAMALADLATKTAWTDSTATGTPIPEIAGPRVESLADLARRFAAHRGDPVRVEEVTDPADPDRVMEATGGLLPGPQATITGPTFTEWLEAGSTPLLTTSNKGEEPS
jgi:uncharacterized protein YbjT (DUF2867 family)